jgi:hypothetical protein
MRKIRMLKEEGDLNRRARRERSFFLRCPWVLLLKGPLEGKIMEAKIIRAANSNQTNWRQRKAGRKGRRRGGFQPVHGQGIVPCEGAGVVRPALAPPRPNRIPTQVPPHSQRIPAQGGKVRGARTSRLRWGASRAPLLRWFFPMDGSSDWPPSRRRQAGMCLAGRQTRRARRTRSPNAPWPDQIH